MPTSHMQKPEEGPDASRNEKDPVMKSTNSPREDPPDRTMGNRPADPNSLGSRLRFPPGVDPKDAKDPGRQTPEATPVDNRSGRRE